MRKTTFYLDESARLGLKELAKRQGRNQAELIREAIAAYLVEHERPKPVGIGAYRSGRQDISESAEIGLHSRVKGGPHRPVD